VDLYAKRQTVACVGCKGAGHGKSITKRGFRGKRAKSTGVELYRGPKQTAKDAVDLDLVGGSFDHIIIV
jgi:hypothetical protein